MVTSLTLISIAFAGFRPNDVKESEQPGLVKVQGDVVLGVSDFEKIIKTGTADEAARLLLTLNNWPQECNFARQV